MTNLTDSQVPQILTDSQAPLIRDWSEQKAKLKAKFPILSYADLQYEEERNDEMLKHVQTKLGKTDEEFAAILADISSSPEFFG